MPPNRKRNRQVTPAWVDTLILWFEVLGVIGTIFSCIYSLILLF